VNDFAQGIERRYGAAAGKEFRLLSGINAPELVDRGIKKAIERAVGHRERVVTEPLPSELEAQEAEYV